jgi:glucose/mannose-6-phosphate isomerase
MDLDEVNRFGEVDCSDMMQLVLHLPEDIADAVGIGHIFDLPEGYKKFSHILVTGMGGSGILGDFLCSLLRQELSVPVVVNKDYSIPRFVNSDTLVFTISYSGTTEELIAAYNMAKERGAKIIGVTSGGRLLLLCHQADIPCLVVPPGRQTRTSFGYLLFSLLAVMHRIGIGGIRDDDIQETIQVLGQMRQELGPQAPGVQNQAKSLAAKLGGKLPLIVGTYGFSDVVALRWKQQFNENSKVLARCEVFPELNHNEIVAWGSEGEMLKQVEAIFLRDSQEPPRMKTRIKVSQEFLDLHGVSFTQVWSRGGSPLARLLSLSYFGDFVSLYLAILNDVDPTPIEAIASIKQRMASGGVNYEP